MIVKSRRLSTLFGVPFLVALFSSLAAADESDDLDPAGEPGDAVADGDALPPDDRAPGQPYTIRSLLQTRYQQTWADGGGLLDRTEAVSSDGYRLERAFIRMTADPTKQVGVKLLLDLAELSRKNTRRSVKLAYARLKPMKRVELTFGLQKRPFSLLELYPIASYEIADVGVIDNTIKDLEFGGRDVGAQVRIEPLPKKKWLRVFLGAFRGQAEEVDASPAGVLSGRLVSKPIKHVQLGADVAFHPTRTYTIDKGYAASGDLTLDYGPFRIRGEALWGTRDDIFSRLGAEHFLASWGLVTFEIPIRRVILMPTLRAEWIDLDRGRKGGGVSTLTGALNLFLPQGVRLLVDVTRTNAQAGAFRTNGTAYLDAWTFVGQVQLLL